MTSPILYIEDEEDYRILVKEVLECAGLEVVTAETGQEGLAALRAVRPSLLILDINLPDTDGYALCRELRLDPVWADLPILMLTVRRRPEEWLRGFSSGVNDYVSKPINPPELVERVVNCLEGLARPFTDNETAEFGLIKAAVAGNRGAFEVLIRQHRAPLLDSLRSTVHDASVLDDVMAHALSVAFERLSEFRGEASFFTWLFRIALNEAIRISHKPESISIEGLSSEEEESHSVLTPQSDHLDDALTDQESRHQAMEALDRVPKLYRQMLEMYFLKDLSYEAIAKKLDIPIGTVMSRLFKARKLLQEAGRQTPTPR